MGVIVFMKKKINEKRTHGINNNRQIIIDRHLLVFQLTLSKLILSSLTPVTFTSTLKC